MSTASLILSRFQQAILDNDAGMAGQDLKPDGHMHVYVEGYRLRLVQAIRADYPALASLLGEKEFTRLARAYAAATPSRSWNLDRYPHGFADFIRQKPEGEFPCELARLEQAIAQVLMGEDSLFLAASSLSQLTPTAFGALTLKPRLASRLLEFTHPVNNWLNAQHSENTLPVPRPCPEFLYIYRHKNTIQRAPLSQAAYLLLSILAFGCRSPMKGPEENAKSIEEALEYAIAAHPEHKADTLKNVHLWFADWLAKGFFRAVKNS